MRGRRQPGPDEPGPDEPARGEVIDLATRGLPLVARRRAGIGPLRLIAGAAVLASLGAATAWTLYSARPRHSPAPRPAPAPAPLLAAPSAPAIAAPALPLPGELEALAEPPPPTLLETLPAVDDARAAIPRANPVLVFDADATPDPDPGATDPPDAAAPAAAIAAAPPATGTIARGSVIPAILETAIDPARPGIVRALVSADLRSADGRRVLVARSSRLVGRYAAGAGPGGARVYVRWARLVRPDGAVIDLGGGAMTDAAGVLAGLGSARLLSVIAPADGGGGLAGVRPGEPIRVFAARAFDLAP